MWPFPDRRPPGKRGEDAAVRYLRWRGYHILDRNVVLGRNEIDIIARDGDTIVFVEVRTRLAHDPFPPEDSVGPEKQARIRRAAAVYRSRHFDPNCYYRYDIIAVILPPRGRPQITWYRDAFQD